jgi:hypothetical protein
MDAPAASEGVAGGIPPDNVEMAYCWPRETSTTQRKTKRIKRLVITDHLDYQV